MRIVLASKKLFITIMVAGILALVGLTIVSYHTFSVTTPKVVRIGFLIADLHHTPFFVALSKGFYESEGITVKRFEYVNGPAQMAAFAAGDLDAGYVGVAPALMARAKGVDIIIVASANLEGSALASKYEIKSPLELNGKIVGTPGIGTIQDCLLYMLEKKLNIVVEHRHYRISDLPVALAKGEIDAYIAWEPFATEAVVNGIGRIICTSRDIFPNHQCCVFYVSGKIYREQPDLLKKLLKIHVEAVEYTVNNEVDAIKIFSDISGKPTEIIKNAWRNIIWDYRPNVESMKVFVRYLIEQGKINVEDVPDIDKFIDAVFPPEIRKIIETIVTG